MPYKVKMACFVQEDLTSALSGPRYSRTRRRGRTLFTGARGALRQTSRGPLQRIVRRHHSKYWALITTPPSCVTAQPTSPTVVTAGTAKNHVFVFSSKMPGTLEGAVGLTQYSNPASSKVLVAS